MRSPIPIAALLLLAWETCIARPAKIPGGAQGSRYQELLEPLDLYAAPGTGRPLALAELFAAVITRTLPIQSARQDLAIELWTLRQTYSSYDWPKPVLTSSAYSSDATASKVRSATASYSLGLGLAGATEWGLNYGVDLPLVQFNRVRSLGVETPAASLALKASVGLSLLKGGPFFTGRIPKSQADLQADLSRYSLRGTALQSLLQAQAAYLDLLLKGIRVRVLELGLKLARALQSDIEQMVASGELDQLSLVKAELQVAQSETELLSAQADLASARLVLREILAYGPDDALELIPDPSVLQTQENAETDLARALETARRERPGYLSVLARQRLTEMSESLAFSNVLPQLDLRAGYGFLGEGTSVGNAATQATRFAQPNVSIGVELSVPLWNDPERTNLAIARRNVLKAELARREAENQLVREVSSSLQSVRIGRERLKTSALARQLAEKKLRAEFDKFAVGESNIRNVIDFQSEVNNARIAEVGSRIDLSRSLAELRTGIGLFPQGTEIPGEAP